MRQYVLLAGGLGWRSLSGQCYAVDQFGDLFALSCWLACWSRATIALRTAGARRESRAGDPQSVSPIEQSCRRAVLQFEQREDGGWS